MAGDSLCRASRNRHTLVLAERQLCGNFQNAGVDSHYHCHCRFTHGLDIHGMAVLAGLGSGIFFALLLAFGEFEFVQEGKAAGFHPSLIALAPNLGIAILGSHWMCGRRRAVP